MISRRRFIEISALAPPLLSTSCERVKSLRGSNKPQQYSWQGTIFGARAEITFQQITKETAALIIPTLTHEISRLEGLFSLYEPSSLINILNLQGKVHATDFEFKELLTKALSFSAQTEGLFDPSIQSYWKTLHSSHLKNATLTQTEKEEALKLVNFRDIINSGSEVKFTQPGMSITLNGIAHGYITDKIYELLSKNGFSNILINLGEYRALGNRKDAKPWRIHLQDEGRYGQLTGEILELSDRNAIAISTGAGYRFSATSKDHHLINPLDGTCFDPARTIAVQAPDATTADALSTTCAVTSPEKAAALVERFPECILLTDTLAHR